ncbi:MAG: hypothetical protein ACXV9S_08895 [Acidimicrobiia bacterium]
MTTTTTGDPRDPRLARSPLDIRGRRGAIDFVDTGDPILSWHERPGLWIEIATEDLALSRAHVAALADELRPAAHAVERSTAAATTTSCPYFFDWNRNP